MLLAQIFYPVAFGSVVYGPETFEDNGSGQATFQRHFNLTNASDLYQLFVRNNLGNTSNLSVLLNGDEVLTGQDLLESLVSRNVNLSLNNTLGFLINSSLFSSYTAWIEDGAPGIRIISPATDTVSNGSILLAGFVQGQGNSWKFIYELNPEQYGIKEIVTIVGNNGKIVTSWPNKGTSICTYNKVTGDWVEGVV